MNLNDLFRLQGIDPEFVLALRHRPPEQSLNRVLPWLAGERPEVFNAYQQTQKARVEAAMEALKGRGHVASFLAYGSGRALFVGLYSIESSERVTSGELARISAHAELQSFGGSEEQRASLLWFNLVGTPFYAHWKGRLIVSWPGLERSWWRRAHRNDLEVLAVLEESALEASMPNWDAIDLSWSELQVLPSRWKSALAQWRGIYLIFDTFDGKGYVGSAYGEENLLGRWLNYASSGHGDNKLLRLRDPRSFHFTILQRVSPDLEPNEVIALESSWKDRLHTRKPYGLNEN